jgi:hypothetical protein
MMPYSKRILCVFAGGNGFRIKFFKGKYWFRPAFNKHGSATLPETTRLVLFIALSKIQFFVENCQTWF